MKKDGIAIVHHSNLKNIKNVGYGENWLNNRDSNVSKEEFYDLAVGAGFFVQEQGCIDWGVKDIDCISVIKK